MAAPIRSVQLRRLTDPADAGLSGPTTAIGRLALVAELTAEAWALAGLDMPTYTRATMPVHVVRRGPTGHAAE